MCLCWSWMDSCSCFLICVCVCVSVSLVFVETFAGNSRCMCTVFIYLENIVLALSPLSGNQRFELMAWIFVNVDRTLEHVFSVLISYFALFGTVFVLSLTVFAYALFLLFFLSLDIFYESSVSFDR